MKRLLGKRLLGGLLAGLLFVGSLPLVLAAQTQETPVIVVPGMGSALYRDGENGREAIWPIAFDDGFMEQLSPVVNDLMALIRNPEGDLQPVVDQVLPVAKELLEPLACNPDGTSKDATVDVGFHWTDSLANHPDYLTGTQGEPAITRALCDKIGADQVYLFMYDWRLDVTEHAVQLRAQVEKVKAEKGVDKVSIVSGSMGTAIVSAYLDAYGASDLKNCVFLSPAFQGTSLCGELFQKKLVLNKEAVLRYFENMALPEDIESILLAAESLGLLDTVFTLLNRLADEYLDQIYAEVLIPVFATMPGFWGVTAHEYYDGAIEQLHVNDPAMLARIEKSRSAQRNLEANLKAAQENGTYIAVIAHYGIYGTPLTALADQMADGLIDTAYASAGAVCSTVDGTLGAGYTQEVMDGHNHLSADGQIDASTCILPETTWFLKDAAHMVYVYGTDSMDLVVWLVTTDDTPTVFSNADFTQFMQFYADGALTPIVTQEKPETSTTQPVPATTAEPATGEETQNPATGDDHWLGIVTLFVLSGGAVALLRKKRT